MDVLRPASAAIETVGVVTKMVLETTASMLTIASERVAVDQEQKQTDMEQALAAINWAWVPSNQMKQSSGF